VERVVHQAFVWEELFAKISHKSQERFRLILDGVPDYVASYLESFTALSAPTRDCRHANGHLQLRAFYEKDQALIQVPDNSLT
jgi:hypothetical protein